MLNMEELEEFFIGNMEDSISTRWFIVREDQHDLYYLKDYTEATSAVLWTTNMTGSKRFMSQASASEFLKAFSIKGRNEKIIEKEV